MAIAPLLLLLIVGLLAALAAALVLGTPARAHTAHGGSKAAAAQPEQKDWGIAGDPKRVGRTIEIRMGDDMRFVPARLEIKLGETIRLVAVNRGRVMHEIVIGTAVATARWNPQGAEIRCAGRKA